jgi:hypothetical protein
MGTLGSPETSVNKYQRTLRNTPEEQRSLLNRGGSLKSRKTHKLFLEKPEGRDSVGSLDVYGRIILKDILKKEYGEMCTELVWMMTGTSGRLL